MANCTNADVCRFLKHFFDTGNQFKLGKIKRFEGSYAKICPWCKHYLNSAKGLALKR
ncbi:MAG: hypothetical protein KME19_00735 [Microcoleus vaginatus WJT46-NPBG5]|jgi:hypothetical protein|nr:hypothetical protein [Microcoleus vaginatus WJT46-NPBG5]